jgi:membrane-bound lytic murein transglycosylase D
MRQIFFFPLLLILSSSNLHLLNASVSEVQEVEHAIIALPAISDELTNDIMNDFQDRIPEEFNPSDYMAPLVRFWFDVYTRFSSDQILVHDKVNLDIHYTILDFSPLKSAKLTRFGASTVKQALVQEKVEEIKTVLRELAAGENNSKLSLSILRVLKDSSTPPPEDDKERRAYFLGKIENLRTQTGQRDIIENGIERYAPLEEYLRSLVKKFDHPTELLAIPFLESSFNEEAHSKAGARGVWQFMPLIASFFMPKRGTLLDYRVNPLIASVAAQHLLEENYRILKRWDLAVTAYNSGTKHLLRARREVEAKTLDDVLQNYQHPHLGFASKNFYAEYLALVHTLAYRNEIFPAEKNIAPMKDLRFVIAKCSFSPGRLERWEKLRSLNSHLFRPNTTYPRGTILVWRGEPDKKFRSLNWEQVVKVKPKDWEKRWLANQSCSTR